MCLFHISKSKGFWEKRKLDVGVGWVILGLFGCFFIAVSVCPVCCKKMEHSRDKCFHLF